MIKAKSFFAWELQSLKVSMQDRWKYYANNSNLSLAAFLDPRHKDKFFNFSIFPSSIK